MRSRAATKGRKLLFLAAVCLLPALLLSPTAEASRSLPATSVSLEPPAPRRDAEAPPAPRLDLFHLEDELLVEILTGVEPKHHQALLEHRRPELLSPSSWTAAIQKTASGVSTNGFELNVQKGKPLKPDLRWTVPFYAKARFYDPEVGRFLTEDPAEGDLTTPPSLHRYLYAYGNPTVYWDPDGRQAAGAEVQALQAAEEAARAYPEVRDKRLDEFDLIEDKALRALAVSGITDPLSQRAFLVEYAGETLGTNFEAASALTTHILGRIQPWEFEGKDWTRQMTEVKLEWAKQSEFIHTWGYIYINLWLMTVGAGEGVMEMPITTQQKLATGAARLEMTAGSIEGMAPLAPRNTLGGPGRSGGTSFDPTKTQPSATQLRDLPPVRTQSSSQAQSSLRQIDESVGDGSFRSPETGQNLVKKALTDLKAAVINKHRSLNQSYTWGAPPGGHWSQGVGHQTRLRLGIVGTEKELHHWLIPQRATWAPNYIKNQGWNLTVAANRAAHARIDTAFSVSGVKPYPLPIRPWMAMPNGARATTVGTGAATGAGIAYWLAEGD